MSFRKSIAALLGAGVLLVGVGIASPASAAPGYPPGDQGPTGSGTLSATQIVVGNQVIFGGCGFVANTPITVAVDGATVGTVNAGGDGCFSTPVRFARIGVYTVTGTGLEELGVSNGAATSPGGVDSSLATGATVSGAAFLAPMRVVTAIVTVVPVNGTTGGTTAAPGSGSGGLPFTGLETGLLVAVALVLIGGGLALRIGSRRRRTAI